MVMLSWNCHFFSVHSFLYTFFHFHRSTSPSLPPLSFSLSLLFTLSFFLSSLSRTKLYNVFLLQLVVALRLDSLSIDERAVGAAIKREREKEREGGKRRRERGEEREKEKKKERKKDTRERKKKSEK